MGFPCSLAGKESACNAGNLGLIPGLGRSPGEGNGNPLQYSCLESPMDCTLSGHLCPWDSPGKDSQVGCHALLQGNLPNPGMEYRSPSLQVDSLPSEPPGKPKHTRVGSLSCLQGIFLTQESNQALLHCRQILYQLSYQGSPCVLITNI